ncbi:MAG: glutamate-1-semialdehyde 2,1-aminomutase, partial [Candidatus Thermoplasmatota archaeon]
MKSNELYKTALKLMPGGVNSPIRAFPPYPKYIKNGKGAMIEDVDGKRYIDYCMAYGALILGHSNSYVNKALREQLEYGTIYGAPIEKEIKLAKEIIKYYPGIDMVRFVNSGCEATMSAVRLARAYTKKDGIIKIKGGYHGSHDSLLTNSLGVPSFLKKNVFMVPYNSAEKIKNLIKKNRNIGTLIMEPILGNIGLILPEKDYLKEVREITIENDVILIFDEVITGFRIKLGGAQEYYNVIADMTTIGKAISNGIPFGAYGGRKEIMELVAPLGKVYQAGTYCGNPLSLTSALATIDILKKNSYKKFERMEGKIFKGLNELNLNFQAL